MSKTWMDRPLSNSKMALAEIDKIVGNLINRGFPEECKEWMLSNLKKLNGLNDAIGNVLDVW